MDYWIAINNEKIGPLTLEEVLKRSITPETLVWHEGLPTWVPAGSLTELSEALGSTDDQAIPAYCRVTAPAVLTSANKFAAHDTPPPMPRTYFGWSIAAIVLCCMIPAIVALVNAVRVSSLYTSGDFAGAQRASDRAELWLIISIVFGIVSLPFYIVLQTISA